MDSTADKLTSQFKASERALQLCYLIEALPASIQQTEISILASEVRTSLNTLAAECLRLREDKKRLDWLETGESKDDPIEWPSGRVTRKAIDLCRQARDAAKEAK